MCEKLISEFCSQIFAAFDCCELGFSIALTSPTVYTECPRYKYTKIKYIFVPKRFMKFIFSALYRVTQKVFNTCQYTSMWAPVVA
jgi:hypothetical protein